jgi:hypothetical protein
MKAACNDIFSQRILTFSYRSNVLMALGGSSILEEKITEAFPSATFLSLYWTAELVLGAGA